MNEKETLEKLATSHDLLEAKATILIVEYVVEGRQDSNLLYLGYLSMILCLKNTILQSLYCITPVLREIFIPLGVYQIHVKWKQLIIRLPFHLVANRNPTVS